MANTQTPEHIRLAEDARRKKNWQRWGPYLSERQWGTVREDYSADGNAWNYFTHDQSRSRAYRWGEDGLLGWTDRECRLCFAVALWNGKDPILKERLFGLSNPQGNHGEDVKECYYFLSSSPTHSYAKALYKYPQAEFPYADLIAENARRTKEEREYELEDTGIFDENRYFDVFTEYAKNSPNDTLIRITVANRGPEAATLHVLPTLWFRNSWSWGCQHDGCEIKPRLALDPEHGPHESGVLAHHATLQTFRLALDQDPHECPWIFTENETNNAALFGSQNASPYVKDAFHRHLIHGEKGAINPKPVGTKTSAVCILHLQPGEERVLRLRLAPELGEHPFTDFNAIFAQRIAENEAFYETKLAPWLTPEQRNIILQAYAGLLWSKQFYHYVVEDWLRGDPDMPPPPAGHSQKRNADWHQVFSRDVLSMPDTWEYPWYAAWDLAFHMIPFARIDGEFAKNQLVLLLREWYMHPNGQIPAYEWNFGDVNPPVHAWACWRVYKISGRSGLGRDRIFLERCFQKLLLNFTWWVNRKDVGGKHVFSGGFLGLDNIGLFDRSQPLPGGRQLEQADGTAWMAFYCGTMLSMAMELAVHNAAYEDIASKFFEHFIGIVDAMNAIGGGGLWNEEDGFYYDQISYDGHTVPIRIRSLVGIIPLLAVEVLEQHTIDELPGFRKRMRWFVENRKDLAGHISYMERTGPNSQSRRLLAIPSKDRLVRVLKYVLDEKEFLSPHGVRSLSKVYETPYDLHLDGTDYRIRYDPAESTSGMFGGNSNWRGPVWFPINYLLIEALERYHHFYGDTLKVECPTGSGNFITLTQVAQNLATRLGSLFETDAEGHRPIYSDSALSKKHASDPHWKELVLFHEYFHAETGRGLGANHQTGWTALITRCFGMLASGTH